MASKVTPSQAVLDPSSPTIDVERPNYVSVQWDSHPDGKIVASLTHKFPRKRKANGQIRF